MKRKYILIIVLVFVLGVVGCFVVNFLRELKAGDEGYRQSFDFSSEPGKQTLAMMNGFEKRNEHWLKGIDLQEAGKYPEALAEYQQIPRPWLKDEALLGLYVAMKDKVKAREVFEHMKTLTKDEGLLKSVEEKLTE